MMESKEDGAVVYLRERRRVLLPFTAGNALDQTMTKHKQSPTGSGIYMYMTTIDERKKTLLKH